MQRQSGLLSFNIRLIRTNFIANKPLNNWKNRSCTLRVSHFTRAKIICNAKNSTQVSHKVDKKMSNGVYDNHHSMSDSDLMWNIKTQENNCTCVCLLSKSPSTVSPWTFFFPPKRSSKRLGVQGQSIIRKCRENWIPQLMQPNIWCLQVTQKLEQPVISSAF